MRKNLDRLGGLIHSQRVLLALTAAGLSREEAYGLVQRNATKVWEYGADFLTDVPEGRMLLRHFRDLAAEKRAISVFETTLEGHVSYFQAQLRFTFPARDRMTSFVAFQVDAERLRSEYFPTLIASKAKTVEGPTGFPPLAVTLLDNAGRVVYPSGGLATQPFVHERTFQLVFFDPELVGFAAPNDDPRVAVAVIIENGGTSGNEVTGGQAAGPVAKAVMQAVLGGR